MKPNKSFRDWSFRLKDILQAIDKIEQFTKDMPFSEFKKNELVSDAVIRNLEVIGEACNGIPLIVHSTSPHIPWKQIIGLRNILIHEYFGVDLKAVWETICHHLPILKQQIKELSQSFL